MPPAAQQPLQGPQPDTAYDVTVGSGGGYGYGYGEAMGHSPLPGSENLLAAWAMPSTATVGPQELPRILNKVKLLAARGEKESLQIALRPCCAWGPPDGGQGGLLRVHVSDFRSSSGGCLRVGEQVTLRRVLPVCGIPDALVPMPVPTSCLRLRHGETAALWLSLHVPPDQAAGTYEGEVVLEPVTSSPGPEPMEMNGHHDSPQGDLDELESQSAHANGGAGQQAYSNGTCHPGTLRLSVSLVVWDFVLPTTPSLPAVMGVSECVIEDRFGVSRGSSEWRAALDAHFWWLLQFRISPYFCRWEKEMQVHTYTCPWPLDHPQAEAYFSDPRLAAYALPYAGIGSDEGQNELQKTLWSLRDRPHFKKAYFYLWDEPFQNAQYDRIRQLASDLRASAPAASVLTTYYSGPRDGGIDSQTLDSLLSVPQLLRPHCQIHCVSEWAFAGREEAASSMREKMSAEANEEFWTYVCMGPGDPQPNFHLGMRGTQQRAVVWRVWKEGGTGFLYWGTNCYDKARTPSAEVRFRPGLPWGDGVLFYPGQAFSPESAEPVASCRLERFLSGMQDYEYLALYARTHGRTAAENLLASSGAYANPGTWTLEHGPIDVLRDEIAKACLPRTNPELYNGRDQTSGRTFCSTR